MIKRVLVAVAVFAAPVCPVSAQDAKVRVDMVGIGGMSCTHWRSTQEHRAEGTVWIYGFWTGLNYVAAASDQDQSKASSAAMIAAVEKAGRPAPWGVLAAAAWSAYLDLNKN